VSKNDLFSGNRRKRMLIGKKLPPGKEKEDENTGKGCDEGCLSERDV
jgi:hypothetical protein